MESRDKPPINLKEQYGSEYETSLDCACEAYPELSDDPWYFQIPCKYGHIYPHSSDKMGYYCEGGKIRAKLKKEHPELDIAQWAEDVEAVFLFTPDQFEIIALFAQPLKKRRSLVKSELVSNVKITPNALIGAQ